MHNWSVEIRRVSGQFKGYFLKCPKLFRKSALNKIFLNVLCRMFIVLPRMKRVKHDLKPFILELKSCFYILLRKNHRHGKYIKLMFRSKNKFSILSEMS